MTPIRYILILVGFLIFNPCFSQRQINVVSLEHGSTMVKTPPSQVDLTERNLLGKYSAGAMFDQSPKVWASKNTQFPFVFVVEATEEYAIQKLIFNNKTEFFPGIEAKKVRVELSTTDAQSGYQTVGEYELKKEVVNEFSIAPTKARWIRMSVLSNYGNEEHVQLAEFEARGVPANKISHTVEIDGVWHTNWQDMTFEQEGNSFSGRYIYRVGQRKFKGKVLNGKISRNLIEFDWDEGNIEGSAKLWLNLEGNRISGLWRNAKNAKDFNLWTMSRSEQESKAIEYSGPSEIAAIEPEEEKPKPAAPKIAAPPVVEVKPPVKIGDTEVEVGKTIVLKNVFFDVGKSVVSSSSYPELDILYEYLKENPKMKVEISGHTDKIGDRKKNLILSQQRADSIEEYLVGKGLDKRRIDTIGKGDTQTLCPPPCKRNRRVDFLLKEK